MAQNKFQFEVETEKKTFFEAKDALNKTKGKLPIYDIPLSFDLTNSPILKRKVNTSKIFLERCLTLAKYQDARERITSFLYQ